MSINHNTELDKQILYNQNLIGSLDKELIFDKYKAARKFAKVRI